MDGREGKAPEQHLCHRVRSPTHPHRAEHGGLLAAAGQPVLAKGRTPQSVSSIRSETLRSTGGVLQNDFVMCITHRQELSRDDGHARTHADPRHL